MSIRSRAMEAATASAHHQAERTKTYLARLAAQRAAARRDELEPWAGLHSLEQRTLLSATMDVTGKAALVTGLTELSQWSTDLENVGQFAELLPFVDQDQNQPVSAPQDPDELFNIGRLLNLGSEDGGADGIFTQLKSLAVTTLAGTSDTTAFATALEGLTLADGSVSIAVEDLSNNANDVRFTITLTVTRDQLNDLTFDLGQEADDLGFDFAGNAPTVDLNVGLNATFTFGYDGAGTGFFLALDEMTATATIDDGGDPFALATPIDLNVGVLGATITGATVQVDAHVDVFFADALIADGKIRVGELQDAIANDEMVLLDTVAPTLAPSAADGFFALTSDANFELKVGANTLSITLLASATTDNTSIDDLVDDVQDAVSDALTAATLSPTLVTVALDETAGFKLKFTSSDASNVFTFISGASDTAATELGLTNPQITLTATNNAVASGILTADANFSITVNGSVTPITILQDDTDGTNGAANANITDLAADFNAALIAAGLAAGVVSVQVNGTKLELLATRNVSITIAGAASTDLGFTNAQSALLPASDALTAQAAVIPALYGQPSGEIDFDLILNGNVADTIDITINAATLDGNRGSADFLADLNVALQTELTAEGFDADLIVARRVNGRYVFEVNKQTDTATLKFEAAANDPMIAELGFADEQTATRYVSTAMALLPISAKPGFSLGEAPADETVTIGSATESLFGYTRTTTDSNGDDKIVLDGPPVTISTDLAGFGALKPDDLLTPLLKLAGFLDSVGDSKIYQQFLPLLNNVQLVNLFGKGSTLNPFMGFGDVLREQLKFLTPLEGTDFIVAPSGRLSADATFEITVTDGLGVGQDLVLNVTVAANATDGTKGLADPVNDDPIGANVGISDLISDINEALVAAFAAVSATLDSSMIEVAFIEDGSGNATLRFFSDRAIEITAIDVPAKDQLGLAGFITNDVNGLIQQKGIATFSTIQELLTLIGGAGLFTTNYDAATDELTFDINIDADQPGTDVPFQFDFSLDPQLKALDIGAAVTLNTNVGLAISFGIDFTPTDVPQVVAAAENLLPQNGQLSADATFNLLFSSGGPPVQVAVTVAKADTDANTSLTDLVADVQSAVDGALGNGLLVVGLDTTSGFRLTFTSSTGATLLITVDDPADTAVTELGLSNQSVALIAATAQASGFNGQLGGEATFTVSFIGPDGQLVDLDVTIPAAATASNGNLDALIRDINDALEAALDDAGLETDLIIASIKRETANGVVTARKIQLVSDRTLTINFVTDGTNTAPTLGFTNGQSESPDTETAVGGVTVLTALSTVTTPATGRVTGDEFAFRLIIGDSDPIEVIVGDVGSENIATNTDLDDLLADLNAALATALTGAGFAADLVVATREGNQIKLTLDESAGETSLRVFADSSDPFISELGFRNGQVDFALANDGFFFADDAVIAGTVDLSLKDPTNSTGIFGFLGLDIDESKAALQGNLSVATGFNPDRAVGGRIALDDLIVQPAVIIGTLGPTDAFRVAADATFIVTIEGESPISVTVPTLTNSIVQGSAGTKLASGNSGQLSDDAQFTITIGPDTFNVTLIANRNDVQPGSRQNGTNLNQTPEQLLADVKAAIEDASGLDSAELAALVTITLVDGKLQFASRKPIEITATDPNNVAANELGLGTTAHQVTGEVNMTGNQQPGAQVITTTNAVSANKLASNGIFVLRVGAKNLNVTVNSSDTTSNGSFADLAADVETAVNFALGNAGLAASLVTVSLNGSNQLVFTSSDVNTTLAIRSLNNEAQSKMGLVRTPISSTFDLSSDATFTIFIGSDVVSVTVPVSDNATVQDLLADVQAAVTQAFNDALLNPNRITVDLFTTGGDTTKGKLRFSSAELITISTDNTANTTATQLGLSNAFTAVDLAEAINEGLEEAGLTSVFAGVAEPTDGSGGSLIAIGLDSPFQTLTVDFTGSPALAAALGFSSGAPLVSTQTVIGETNDDPPVDVLLGEPVLRAPVITSAIAGGFSAEIDAILALDPTLQYVLVLPGVIAEITDANGDAIVFDIVVKSDDLLDPDAFTLTRTQSTVAENLLAQDVVDVLLNASEVLTAIFGDAAILQKDLPVLSVAASNFNNFVAPLTTFLGLLTTQTLPSTLQELNRLTQEALNITASGSLFTIDGDTLALALDYENSQTFGAPFVIDIEALNSLTDPAPFEDPRSLVSTKNTTRHDITSTAQIDLNIELDFTNVDRANDASDVPEEFVVNDGTSVVTLNISSESDDLFLTALYGLQRVSITAGSTELGDGAGGDAVIAIDLATADGTRTAIAEVLSRSDLEGVAADSPIALDGNGRPALDDGATFFISVDGGTPIEVFVSASNLGAKPNFNINDLLADINFALAEALGDAELPTNLVRAAAVQEAPDGTPGDVGDLRLQLLSEGLLVVTVPTPGSNTAATILGLADGQSGLIQSSITGQASVELELVGKDTEGETIDLGTLQISVPDLQAAMNGVLGSVIFLGDIPPLDDLNEIPAGEEGNRLELLLRNADQLITGIDGVIDDIQTVIELIIEPLGSLPVIGDNIIDPLLDFFEDLRQARRDFRDSLITLVSQNNDIVEEIRELFFNIFGPGGLDILVDNTLDGDVALSDVTVTTELDEPTGSLSDEFVQWDMHLGQSIEFRFPFSLNLGLQNLPGASAAIPNFGFELGAGETNGVTGATPLGSASDTEDGVLDSDATFTLKVGSTTMTVTVLASATNGDDGNDANQSRQDLLSDVQAAVEQAMRDAGLNPTQVTVDINDDGKLRIYSSKDIQVSAANAQARTRLGLDTTSGTLTSQKIDLGGGVVLTFSWDFYLGFGLSLGEGFYINSGAIDAFGDDVKELSFKFEATVPQLTGRIALGLVQAEFEDGTDTRVRVTSQNSIIAKNGDEITKDFLNLDVLFGREYEAQFNITTIKKDGDTNSIDIDFASLGSVNFLQFLIDLNLELFAVGAGVLASADFSDVTRPKVIFVATDPEVETLKITGAEEFGFDPVQVEDQRAIGLGFENGDADATPNGEGKFEVIATRSAPTEGRILSDTDMIIRIGGKDARIVLRAASNDDVEDLDDLAARIQKQLDLRLNQINVLPTDKIAVVEVVEIGGEFFLKIVSEKPVEIRGIDIQEHTGLLVELAVDLSDPDDEDGLNRLTLVDLFGAASVTEVLAPSVTVEANIRLNVDSNTKHITNALENLFGANEGGMGLPSLNFDLKVDLSMSFDEAEEEESGEEEGGEGGTGTPAANSTKSRANKTLSRLGLEIDKFVFDNVTLDVGDLLNNIIKPIAQGITTVFGPIIELVGDGADATESFLTDPLPVLDELGIDLSLLDILDKAGGIGQGIRTLFNAIKVLKGINETIETLGDTGQISFGGWELVFDKESPLYFPRTKLPVPTEAAESLNSVGLPSMFDTEFSASVEPGGFRLDILSINSIINWILGEPFDIFSFNLPTVDINLGIKIPFGIGIDDFNIGFNIAINAQLHIDMGIGYDSTGIQQIIDAVQSGAEPDFADLLDGFFIRNEEGDEIFLSLSFNGSAALGPIEILDFTVFDARASVYAGIYAGLDLVDPNEDGKLRISEVMELTNNFENPENLLALFDATLRVYGGFDFSITLFEITLDSDDLPFDTSFDLSISLQQVFGLLGIEFDGPQPILAEVIEQPVAGQGSLSGVENPETEDVLRINAGPFAYARIFGDTDDSDGGVHYVASSVGSSLFLTAFGRTQEFTGSELNDVTKIIITGTDFGDTFDFSAVQLAIPIFVDGGAGNDLIRGGAAADVIIGGLGDDSLHGGGGDDDLRGGVGNDALNGNAGSDLMDGGTGNDVLTGGSDDDIYMFDRGAGNDTIIENLAGGTNDTIDFSLAEAEARRAATDPTARFRPVRKNLFVTMDIFGTRVTDKSNTITVNPGSADSNGYNYQEGLRIERIITGQGNDLFQISASEANDGATEFATVLDGFAGSDTYIFFGGDPRQVPAIGAKQFQTDLNGQNQIDDDVRFLVAVGDNAPFEVNIPGGGSGSLVDAINAALAAGLASLPGNLSPTLITAALDTNTGLLTFTGGAKTFFAIYTTNDNTVPRQTPDSNATQDQLGIPVIHANLLGENLSPADSGDEVDIDRIVAEGSNGDDRIGLTDESITIRAVNQSVDEAAVITYGTSGGDSGVEVIEVRLRAGNDVVAVQSTPANSSVLLLGQAGDDTFLFGVDAIDSGSITNVNALRGNETDGPIQVDGGLGSNSLSIFDTSDLTGDTGNLNANLITGMGMDQGIEYTAVDVVNLHLSGGDDDFTIEEDDTQTAQFNLFTGEGDDLITLLDGVTLSGRIDGQAGRDTMSYRLYSSSVSANLETGRATGLFDGFEDGLRGVENLVGSVGGDFFTGDEGENLFIGNGGSDVLVGAGGDDTLIGGFANYLGNNNIQLVDRRKEGTVDEIPFDGFLMPGDVDGDDSIFGNGGDDLLIDGLGSDKLFGGLGDDTYRLMPTGFAGAGPGLIPPRPTSRDEVTDTEGSDTLDFSLAQIGVTVNLAISIGLVPNSNQLPVQTVNVNGDQLLLSGLLEDMIGSDFGDTLTGNLAANTISGGEGGDILRGGEGADTLLGNEGNDDLGGDNGNDNLRGGEGIDKLTGGGGIDTADYIDDPAPITASFLTSQATDGFGDLDTLATVEVIAGTTGNDTMIGSNSNNIFATGGGDDTINGTKGSDVLRITGTGGDDLITVRNSVNPGEIEIVIANAGSTTVQTITLSNVRTIQVDALAGNDTIRIHAINATGLLDVLVNAGDGDDTIDGNPVAGTLSNLIIKAFGGAGDDTFFSGGGADTFDGGLGSDTVDFARAAVAVNAKMTGASNDGHGKKDTYKLIENLLGSQFNDTLAGDKLTNILQGRDGNDTITGGGGADQIDGGDGNDTLTASGTGAAILVGGEGNDTFSGAANHFASYASSTGPVTFDFSVTANTVSDGLGGTDTFKKIPTIIGSDFSDVFTGGRGTFTFIGAGGDDAINTGNSTMTIQWRAGDGSDQITGGTSGTQTFLFEGSAGDDELTLTNDSGTAVIETDIAGDNETIRFTQMDAIIINTLRGDDEVTLNAVTTPTGFKTFTLNLGKGDDRLDTLAALFKITAKGEEGDDILSGGGGIGDALDGGLGFDTVTYEHAPIAVNASLASTTNDGFGKKDSNKNFERLIGSDFNDILKGDGKANTIEGGEGNDQLFGGSGNDTLRGGEGNDTLLGEAGIDLLSGGDGADTLNGGSGAPADIADYSGENVLNGIAVDLALNQASDDGFGNVDTFINIAGVTGSQFDDTILGNDLANTIDGSGGEDTINARGGNDTILYSTTGGEDTVEAGLGDDTVIVSGGNSGDTIEAVAAAGRLLVNGDTFAGFLDAQGAEHLTINSLGGNDAITLGAVAAAGILDASINLGNGNDVFDGSAADVVLTVDGGAGNDRIHGGLLNDSLIGGAGVDTVDFSLAPAAVVASLLSGSATHADLTIDSLNTFENITGSAFNDVLTGDNSANTIRGGAGNDTISGLAGNDYLYGEADNDTINGGFDVDHLDGGAGNDILTVDKEPTPPLPVVPKGQTPVPITILVNDTLLGGAGDDTITGNIGDDVIRGGLGADILDGGEGDDHITGGEGSDIRAEEVRAMMIERLTALDGATTSVAFPGDGATLLLTGDTADDFTAAQLREAMETLTGVDRGNVTVSASSITWNITFLNGTGDAVDVDDLREAIEAITGVDDDDLFIEKTSGNNATITLIGISASSASAADVLTAIEDFSSLDPGDVEVDVASTLWTAMFLNVANVSSIGSGEIAAALTDNLAGLTDANVTIAQAGRLGYVTIEGAEFDAVSTGDIRSALEAISHVDSGDVATAMARATWTVTLGGDVGDLADSADLLAAVGAISGVDAEDVLLSRTSNVLTITLLDGSAALVDEEALAAALEAVSPLKTGDVTALLTSASFSITFLSPLHSDRADVADDNDTLLGGLGNDNLEGGAGNDTANGGLGDDTFDGGTGNDTATDDAGSDTLRGWIGSDNLDGGGGNDRIFGDEGDDTLTGNLGADAIDNGPGNDTVNVSLLTGPDTVLPGPGSDEAFNVDTNTSTPLVSGPPTVFQKPKK